MAEARTVWGIDIGLCALKALKLRGVEGDLRVEAFDVIEHPKILSQPDADRETLVGNALEKFLARNNVAGSTVCVSAPGQTGFTRFVKLPPVEAKQIPEIVRFEAEQQIPFDINDVIWRWQTFPDPDSPDIEVGIFAMKRSDVAGVIDWFSDVGTDVDTVQMGPLALFNFMDFDDQCANDGATLLVDVGADKTDLVVSDGPRIWTRTLQLGGNNFTEALVKVFKLSFAKAEKLKRTAATSKYARQIFQAMRPVFAELVQEVQRSIGYYTSLHRESRFRRVIGLGNGFRLPGLQKFLEQNLGIPVVRVDSYNKIVASATVNAPAFTENVLSFATAYGLALQGLELTKIETNLLPSEIARQRLWSGKRWWFAATAASVVLAMAVLVYSPHQDARVLARGDQAILPKVQNIVDEQNKTQQAFNEVKGKDEAEEDKVRENWAMLEYRDFWPSLLQVVSDSLAEVASDQVFLNEVEYEDKLKSRERTTWQIVDVASIYATYHEDITDVPLKQTAGGPTAGPSPFYSPRFGENMPGAVPPAGDGGMTPAEGAAAAPPKQPGYILVLEGATPLPEAVVTQTAFLFKIKNRLIEMAARYPQFDVLEGDPEFVTVQDAGSPTPTMGGRRGAGLGMYEGEMLGGQPATPEQKVDKDTRFVIRWKVAIKAAQAAGPAQQVAAAGGSGGA